MNIFFILLILIVGSLKTTEFRKMEIVEPIAIIQGNEIKENEIIPLNDIKLVDYLYNTENIMISPLSLNLALGMISNGASGETLHELENYLGKDIDSFNDFALKYSNNTNVLKIANSIWCTDLEGYEISKSFQNITDKYYGAEVKNVNFYNNNTQNIINEWISDKTEGLIDNAISYLNPETRMMLVNALYFKGTWEEEFEDYQINDDYFINFNKEKQKVEMMMSQESIYYENDYAIGFEKEYKNGDYSFIAILPKNEGEFCLEDLDLNSFLNNKEYTDVNIKLPKFEFDSSFNLNNVLKELGIKKAFTSNAEFYNLLENKHPLMISEIFQKTKIKLDEKGTEAAAVTVIVANDACAIPMEEPKVVFLDRPFAFIIMDNNRNTPLFIGKVVNFD